LGVGLRIGAAPEQHAEEHPETDEQGHPEGDHGDVRQAPLFFQWQFNGVDILGATSDTLVVPGVNLGNEGDYRVLVTDNIATVPSAVARLTVMVPPTILIPPVGQTNLVGANLSFTVTCSGSVPMGFIWRQGSIARSNIVSSRCKVSNSTPRSDSSGAGGSECLDSIGPGGKLELVIRRPCGLTLTSGASALSRHAR
jgi:hypothetical protein